VAMNNSTNVTPVAIRLGTQMVKATMPAQSFASFRIWDDAVNALPAARQYEPLPSSRTLKIAGDKFELPGEFAGTRTMCSVYNLQGS